MESSTFGLTEGATRIEFVDKNKNQTVVRETSYLKILEKTV